MTKIIQFLFIIYNYLKQIIIFPVWKIKNRNKFFKLYSNKQFKNIHKDQRCFILGNGPSLNEEDLSVLKNEVVFTVNQIARNPQFKKFNSSYHFCVDDNFFDLDLQNDSDLELFETMHNAVKGTKAPICFYPLKHKEYLEKNGLADHTTHYLLTGLYLTDNFNSYPNIIKYIPSFGTVVQFAIYVAIYMGFSEIYLLGCDSTGIMSTLNAILKEDNSTYSYEITKNEKLRMEEMVKRSKVVDYAYSYYMTLKGFEILNRFCKRKKILLINCSNKSVLDMLPFKRLSEVIKYDFGNKGEMK